MNVTEASGAGLPMRGEGCVAADLNGDGHTDLFVTTATNDVLLWNNGDGTFTEGARKAGVVSFGWHSGAAVADVNGDGRPDLFVAGYTDMSSADPRLGHGLPDEPPRRARRALPERGRPALPARSARRSGLDPPPYDHSLGAVFTDVNGDGRPDLYVANDEDPNRLYLNEPGGPLGFHFVDAAKSDGVADANAGMGIAAADFNGDGRPISSSPTRAARRTPSTRATGAGVRRRRARRSRAARQPRPAGATRGSTSNNAASSTSCSRTARSPSPTSRRTPARCRCSRSAAAARSSTPALLPARCDVNGRGLAAADYDNDGRVDLAINSIGGKLLLLHNTSKAGHWLEVQVQPFSPGAVVTASTSTAGAGARGARRLQLPLVRGPARALRPRRRDAR